MGKVYIIAEAGVNHNGSLGLALQLCDAAKKSGADAVKFQTFKTERNITKDAQLADYQMKEVHKHKTQFDMVKELELSYADFEKIKYHCDDIGIEFLSTPDEPESLHFLSSLGINKIKIASGEINNLPYLREIGASQKLIILSTGMSDLEEIKTALHILMAAGARKESIIVLHCNSEYPSPYGDVNLLAMLTIRDAFDTRVGYSDHTLGIEIPIAAVTLGAEIIEKHFTLDRKMEGPDHQASMEPHEFEAMVKAIRNVERALGNGIKKPSPSELKNKSVIRRSIVAARDIRLGEVFDEENLAVKRPGTGLSPMEWDRVMGMTAKRPFKEDELIEL